MKRFGELFMVLLCISLAVFLLLFPETGNNEAYRAVIICSKSVIPVLFPFSVIASCLINSKMFLNLLSKTKTARIFGLSDIGSSAVFFGWVFGFPIGAKTAAELYKNGNIGKCDAEKLMAVSNNSGPAFIISVIGSGFFGNRKFGIYLYFLQIVCGIISGIITTRLLFPEKSTEHSVSFPKSKKNFSEIFTESVNNSAISSVSICGYIILFSVLSAAAKMLLGKGHLLTLICSLSEITNGTALCAENGNTVFCAFAVGFSGLSVICQVMSFASKYGLSCKILILNKLTQGLLCGIITFFLKFNIPVAVRTVEIEFSPVSAIIAIAVLFIISIKFVLKVKNS